MKFIISQESLDALMCATLIMIVLVLMADFNKPKEIVEKKVKTNKPSKAQKRQIRKTL